jgi:hypothetical protein
MSKVTSFRLNPNNPREAESLTILQNWLAQGFSTRHTMTVALLNLDSANSQATDNDVLQDLSQQIKEILKNIEIGSSIGVAKKEGWIRGRDRS